jgi:uncharacterized protein (TIGR02646 family)
MRPVNRGEHPVELASPMAHYRDAAPYLRERLGRYCSYCERWIATSLAVEHIAPKHADRAKERDWNNFLLACTDCNSTKGTKVSASDSLWPDQHNTFNALLYREDGAIKPHPALAPTEQARSAALLQLVGLDKPPKDDNSHRWDDRMEAWGKAQRARELLQRMPPPLLERTRALALETLTGHGGWSIWMTVFSDDPVMQNLFVDQFPGTARERLDLPDLPDLPSVQT